MIILRAGTDRRTDGMHCLMWPLIRRLHNKKYWTSASESRKKDFSIIHNLIDLLCYVQWRHPVVSRRTSWRPLVTTDQPSEE